MIRLKARAKSGLAKATSLLPKGARNAIAGALSDIDTVDYPGFLRIAHKFNVVSLKVRGDYGVFQSAADDSELFGVYASSGTWATPTNDRLREFFAARGYGTYVDVGANIGLTTVPVSQNRNVRCFALEPEPTNFANLCENIRVNCPHGNVVPLQVAAFSEKTTVEFEVASGNLADHRIRRTEKPGKLEENKRRTITVEAAPLDELVPACEGPLAVKIDTQGAEPFVVEGGRKILAKADLVIMEFWPYGMNRLNGDPEQALQYLERQFGTIMFAKEERDVRSTPSVKSAVDRLREYAQTKAEDHMFYLDVIATR